MKSHDSSSVKTVLVVEDEPTITSVCRRVLIGEGFEVNIADNGKIAQKMIDEEEYDLCLIDVRTPIMGGEELYVWLLQEHPRMAKRVIFTTGDIMGGEVRSLLNQSDRPFLPKPFTPDELRSIVRKATEEIVK